MAGKRKVFIIGWDSAPADQILGLWLRELPNLSRLAEQGTWGPLRSSDPPITVPAWTSMFTSLNPGQLGFFGFRNRTIGTYDGRWIATSAAVRAPRLWDILGEQGWQVCVLGVPQTYPVSPVNGVLVSSFLAPDTSSDYVHPPELKSEIDDVADGYMLDVENFRIEDKEGLLAQIYAMTNKRYAVARHLLTSQPWDLFAMVEMGPDRIQHGFWRFADPHHPNYQPGNLYEKVIVDYYRHLDEQLGSLLELVPDDSLVLVVSDHGAKCMAGTFNVNDWLIQAGYLNLKEPVSQPTEFDASLVDWPATVAWAWGGYYSRIFLNVAGREPQGTVAATDYARMRGELQEALKSITDDQGREMDTVVLRPEQIYSGPHVTEAPDLLVYFDDLSWRAGQNIGNAGLYSSETELGPDDAVHDYHGIFVMYDPLNPDAGYRGGLHLVDVAPTVLARVELPSPAHMEGKAIS